MGDIERHVMLDTETTGIGDGHRIIEIGAVEVDGADETGRMFHRIFDPGRDVDQGATDVHGYTREMLRDKPTFEEHAAEFSDFVRGATLVIHNAAFDIGYLATELAYAGFKPTWAKVVDTLAVARIRYPTYNNTLNSLADRFGVDRRHRDRHGALVDARLLHNVWVHLTGLDQLIPVGPEQAPVTLPDEFPSSALVLDAGVPFVSRPTAAEAVLHASFLAKLGSRSVWSRFLPPEGSTP